MVKISVINLLSGCLMASGILASLFVGAMLWRRKEGNGLANRLLASLLLLSGLTLSNQFINAVGLAGQYPFLYFLPLHYTWSIGPLVYFYFRAKLKPSFRLEKSHIWHWILPISQAILYFSVGFRDMEFKSWLWHNFFQAFFDYVEIAVFLFGLGFYLLMSHRLLAKRPPNWLESEAKWLKSFLKYLTWLYACSFLYDIGGALLDQVFELNIYNYSWAVLPKHALSAFVCLWIAYSGLVQQTPERIATAKQQDLPDRIGLKHLLNEIETFLEKEQAYLNPELTLKVLAKMMNRHEKDISTAINSLGKNFNQYINQKRLGFFKTNAVKPEFAHLSILGMALESGFNSKATFNRAFKEQEGVTPSAFLKNISN